MAKIDWNAKVKAVSKCDINGKACFIHLSLINMFGCKDLTELESTCIEPARIELNKQGEDYNNHIIQSNIGESERFYYCSPLAVRCMAYIAKKFDWVDFLEYSAYEDTSFFSDPKDTNREIRIGDKVEILTPTPDTISPTTPMVNFSGRKALIINIAENGNFRLVADGIPHEVEFSKEHLKLISND
ncbi:MAG: hypothetical protein K2I37_01060 [Muribaculaceae bacterium]|nr:hypothetical protein [Muribaculaceae bacterium]